MNGIFRSNNTHSPRAPLYYSTDLILFRQTHSETVKTLKLPVCPYLEYPHLVPKSRKIPIKTNENAR